MKVTLAPILTMLIFAGFTIGQQSPNNAVTQVRPDPNALALAPDDQKQLDLISDRIAAMKPQLEAARKQQEDAQNKLNEANSFIAQYSQIDTARMAFLFRIAADVCKCETKELEFSADGKSVVRRKPTVGKASDLVTAPTTSSDLNVKPKP